MESAAPPEGFNQFLQGVLDKNGDGVTRKNSPMIMSPLPTPAAPPTGETMFKKKNRHVKTNSQPMKLDTAELQREYRKAKQEAAETRNPSGPDDERQDKLPNESPDQSLVSSRSVEESSSQAMNEAAETKAKRGSGISLAKRLQKMTTLTRSSTDKSSNASNSPRPRSPSKDSTMGGLMRLGNRSVLVSKLGFGMSSTRRESDERDSESDAQTPFTASPAHRATDLESFQQLSLPPALTHSVSAAPSMMSLSASQKRSSGLNNNMLPPVLESTTSLASGATRPNLTLEVPKERLPFVPSDMSPPILQEKNNSASNAEAMGWDVNAARMEQETARLKREHAAMELNMAKTTKGALLIAKSAVNGRSKRSSIDNNAPASEEAQRIALLTLQANNEKRLRELTEKMSTLDKKSAEIKDHANRIRDHLVDQCRRLVQEAEAVAETIKKDREQMKEKELEYLKKNTQREGELKWMDEKISEAVSLKEKGFRDKLNEAETKLVNLMHGNVAAGEHGWFFAVLDHGMQATIELIILGGGTILSIISTIIIYIRFLLKCQCIRAKPSSEGNRNGMSKASKRRN